MLFRKFMKEIIDILAVYPKSINREVFFEFENNAGTIESIDYDIKAEGVIIKIKEEES